MPDATLMSNWIGSTYLSFVRSSVCSKVDGAGCNPQMRGTTSPTQSFPDDIGCKRGNIVDLEFYSRDKPWDATEPHKLSARYGWVRFPPLLPFDAQVTVIGMRENTHTATSKSAATGCGARGWRFRLERKLCRFESCHPDHCMGARGSPRTLVRNSSRAKPHLVGESPSAPTNLAICLWTHKHRLV
jgi:hypothetical protein